jgi:tripartite ATP-independent transporter DctM subunit
MSWQLVLFNFFFSVAVLLLIGVPVSLAFISVSTVGAFVYWGGFSGISQMSLSFLSAVKSWAILPIPLFILLGEIIFRSGIASRAIDVVDKWLGRLPGRLSIIAAISSVLMGTFTGSSLASGSMLASTLLPEMEKRGYKPVMTFGPIGGCGGLAMLIPPSSLAVFLAAVAGVSVGKLLIGGIIPGILLGVFTIGYIVIRSIIQPELAPPYDVPKVALSTKLITTIRDILPLSIIIFSVTGVILFGIATPSEAAATGVLAGFVVVFLYKSISWQKIHAALISTVKTSTMLLTIILGSVTFSQVLTFSGATRAIVSWAVSLDVPPLLIIATLLVIIFFLGCFMEVNSIIMITVPIFLPIVRALGFNDIWFLIMFMMSCETAESTPPFGVMLFLLKGMHPDIPMSTIIKANLPYIVVDLVVLLIVFLFPQIVMWLPSFI